MTSPAMTRRVLRSWSGSGKRGANATIKPVDRNLRLGKAGEPVVHQAPIEFELGKAIRMREGKDVTLISTGGILLNTVRAADWLAKYCKSPAESV